MERLNQAIEAIGPPLEGGVEVTRAGRMALMSEFHFRRMFSTLSTLSARACRYRNMFDSAAPLSQPKLTFRKTFDGSRSMNYRIVQNNAFTQAGLHARVPLIYQGVNTTASEFVGRISWWAVGHIADLSDQELAGAVTEHDGMVPFRGEGTELEFSIVAAIISRSRTISFRTRFQH